MSGKSAVLRQTALIVILAQIGCYVPAKHAQIGLIDKVFTRVGASDNINSGESTFMVEMNEGDRLPALHAKILAYPAYGGRKAYLFAKHIGQGELFVSSKQLFARDW